MRPRFDIVYSCHLQLNDRATTLRVAENVCVCVCVCNIIGIFCLVPRLLSQVTNYHEYISKSFNFLICVDVLRGIMN